MPWGRPMPWGPPAAPTGLLALEWGIQSPEPPMGEFCGTDMLRLIIPAGTQITDAHMQYMLLTGDLLIDMTGDGKGVKGVKGVSE